MKRSFVVSILNQKLTVRSDAEEGHVQQTAGFVDSKIQEVMSHAKTASPLTAAVLASMNIAEELFRQREERKSVVSKVVKKVTDVMRLIDLHLAEGRKSVVGG